MDDTNTTETNRGHNELRIKVTKLESCRKPWSSTSWKDIAQRDRNETVLSSLVLTSCGCLILSKHNYNPFCVLTVLPPPISVSLSVTEIQTPKN